MTDPVSTPDVPLNRRNFLRSAVASSLALGAVPGQTAATDHNCEQAHECDPRIRCFDPSGEDPQTVVRSASWEGELEESYGTVDATTGLDAMAIYRGRVDFGNGDCYPVWDLLIAWDQHFARSGGDTYNFTHTLNIDVNSSDSVNPVDPGDAKYWLEQDPADIEGVDPNAADKEEELREYYESEGALSDLEYSDSELLVTGLKVGLNAAVSLSGYGTVARLGAKVLPMLVGMAVGEEADGNNFEYQIAQHHTPDMGERAGFFYLPKFHAKPDGSLDPGDIREFSVDVNIDFFGNGGIGPNLQETPDSHSHTLDLQFREDRPAQLVGELDLGAAGGTLEYELRNADGAVLDTLYQELTDDPNDTSLAVEEMDYDVWVSEEEFPLQLVKIDDVVGNSVDREIFPEDLSEELTPYETIDHDISIGNVRTVVGVGEDDSSYIAATTNTVGGPDGDVYLPIGTDRYATSDVGYKKPLRDSTVPQPGNLYVFGEDLGYILQGGDTVTLTGSEVSSSTNKSSSSLWIDGDEIRYVDDDQSIRSLSGSVTKSIPEAEPGSLWIEGGNLAFVNGNGEKVVVSGGSAAEVSIDSVDVEPSPVEAGRTVEVSVTYTNDGDAGSDSLQVSIGDRVATTAELSVTAGESGSTTIDVRTTAEDQESSSLEVEALSTGSTASSHISVEEPISDSDAYIVVEEIDVEPSDASPGDTVELTATVTNDGQDGRASGQIYVGDRLADEWSFSSDAGSSEEGAREIDITEDDFGTEAITLSYSPGEGASADLRVADVCSQSDSDAVLAESLSVPDEMRVGESATIEASFKHCGTGEEVASNSLFFAGRDVGGVFDFLDNREVATTSVDVVPKTDEAGDVTVRAEDEDGGIERTVTVHPIHLGIEIGEVTVSDGRFELPLTLTNDASVDAEQLVEVWNGGEVLTDREVSVAAGSSTDVVLEGPYPGGEQTLTVNVTGDTARVTVTPESDEPDCVEVGELEPCDVNGDGLYRDITGDGAVTQTDVVEFFRHQHRDPWKQPDMFDYTGNGTVGQGDVIELFEYVALN